MTDKRWQILGESLINYSLDVQPGERLMIAMYEVETYPLALACYAACIKRGGFPQIQFMSEALKHQVLRYGNEEQISWVPEIEAYGMKWADCYLALRGAFNLNECWDIPSDKIAKYQSAMGKISAMRWENTRWALVRVPNERFAQQANVSYDKIMDMFFDACDVDWEKERAYLKPVVDCLNAGTHFHILSKGTDLELDVKHDWSLPAGKGNIPDGEIASTPVWESVNGKITFDFPATIGGKVIHNMCLTFKDGVCVNVEADDNVDYVNHILDSDECARRVGEYAFGTNFGVDIVTTDILIDEKFGGTMHIAMGRPYDGSYYSSIHWDIIKDLRKDSCVYMDGRLIFKDGAFLRNEKDGAFYLGE